MQSYILFGVLALWYSHGLVSPYFAKNKTESDQVGGIYHGSNPRTLFYYKIGVGAGLE